VYAARDRVDESYDMIRSVRSRKYLYIRNYYPNEPFPIWVPYLNKMPIMQEVMRLDAQGKLIGIQKQWMADSRPPEELYDVKRDPLQLTNLAAARKYKKVMGQMRFEHELWTRSTGDLGHMNEPEMIEQMWPNGIQPVTDLPYFIVNAPEERGSKNQQTGGTYSFPATLSFYCPTHGASVVYTFDSGNHPAWKLYSGQIKLPRGKTTLRVKACRYGYKESEEIAGSFVVK